MVQRKGCRDYGSTVYPGCVRRAYEVREGKLEALGELLGVSAQAVSKWEQGLTKKS